MGAVVEALGHTRVKSDLPHEDKEGYHGEAVRLEGVVKIVGKHVHCLCRPHYVGIPGHADQCHAEGKLQAGEKERQQDKDADDSYGNFIHCFHPS